MKTALYRTVLGLVLVATALLPLTSEAQPGHPGYIVLGDSVDFGVGSACDTTCDGYAVPFREYLEGTFGPTLDLHT